MIRRPYELVQDRKTIFRMVVDGEQVIISTNASQAEGWLVAHTLNREAILELRDTLDEILAGWFCPLEQPKGILCSMQNCMNERDRDDSILCADCRNRVGFASDIIKIDPVQVAGLDCTTFIPCERSEWRLVGREPGQVMQGEDTIDEARRTT